MKIRFRHVLLFFIMCLILSGCAKNSRQKEISEISQEYGVSSDRQLVVYTSHKEEVYLPIIREFENRTGIWVEVRAGGTNELLSEIKKSADAGENACDIMFGGGVEAYEANRDLFLPYVSGADDNIAEAFRSSDNYWTPFTELPIVIVYNNKLVSEEEAPESWADLFDAGWKGRIAFADPTHSGSSYTILYTLLLVNGMDPEEFLPVFYEQLGRKCENSSGDVIPAVSDGSCLIGITLEETALKYIDVNDDITMVYPAEGTSAVPDGCAIVSGTAHRANAKEFINFIIGKETQRYAIEQFHRRTVRNDIDTARMYQSITLIDYDIKKAGKDEGKILELWRTLNDSGIQADSDGGA